MTHSEIFDTCKRILPRILETEQQGKEKYLFIADNGAVVGALLSFGYGAVLIGSDEELRQITEIFMDHAADMYSNNVTVIPLCSQAVCNAIGEAVNNEGVLSCKSYTLYGRKKTYYEAHPYELEKVVDRFVANLEDSSGSGELITNPRNGLIVANVRDNSYRDIAAHIIQEKDIVRLGDEVRIKKEGRFYELYTPDKNEDVLIDTLDNSTGLFRREVYKYIKRLAPKKELTKDMIPFLNCVYDFKEGDMAEYREDMYFTRCIPHRLNIDAECPEILEDFLRDISADDSTVEDLLVEIVAYCMLEGNPWQKMFFIYGSGGNGKSTFFELLRWILGSESMTYKSWADLGESKGRYGIEDKRVIICDDENGAFVREPGALKILTSGEPLSVKKLYADEYIINFTGKIISSGNEIPKTCDRSEGWMRRLVLIPFEGNFRAKPDIHLSEKLRTEETAEAMIMLALIRINKVIKDGFTIPDKVKKLMSEYRVENNHVLQFVLEMGDKFTGKDNAKALSTIYQTYYTNFCNDYGYKRLSYMAFSKLFNKVEKIKYTRPRGYSTKIYYYKPIDKDGTQTDEDEHGCNIDANTA